MIPSHAQTSGPFRREGTSVGTTADRRGRASPVNEVKLDRRPNRHLSFGMESRRCADANVGKLMLRVALEEFLAELGPFELGDPDKLQ